MSDLGLNIKLVAKTFFDRPEVEQAAKKANKLNLSKFGAFVRQSARKSIADRGKHAVSPPGHPPFSHLGLLKKHIYFSYDKISQSVVIGPVPLEGKNFTILKLLEEGGVGKRGKRFVNYAPRPYMRPAFDREKKDMSRFWRDTIKK
jgi:hypothetical protein